MTPHSSLNMFRWLVGVVLLSAGLSGCDSGSNDIDPSAALAAGNRLDSLNTTTSGTVPASEVYAHPYLMKADKISHEEGSENAMPYYEAAVSLFEKEQNWEGMISAKNRISAYYFERFDFDSLLINLEATMELGEKHLDSSSLSFSEVLYWFGIYYERTNDPYKALTFQLKALENRIRHLGDNHLLVAQTLKAIGDTYMYVLSDFYNAESYYQNSVDIKSRLLDSSSVELVRGYYALASAKRLTEDTESAINYGLKALKTALMNPKENKQRIGLCHNILANTYNDKNDYENAKYHYQKAIKISKANSGDNNSDLPVYYNGLGTIYLQQNQFEIAKSYFLKGLEINRSYFPSDLDGIADNFLSLGLVFTGKKQFDSAYKYFNKSLDIKVKEFGEKNGKTGVIYEFIGDMYTRQGQVEIALKNYQKALISLVADFEETSPFVNPGFFDGNYGFRLISVIIKKALALKRHYHHSNDIKFLEASLKTYLLAGRIIDSKRNNDITEESRLVLIENYFQDEMENGIDCAFLLYKLTGKEEYQNTAFQMIEKSKYMLLFESLMKNKKNQQFGVPDSLLIMEKNLKVEMAFFKQNLDKEVQKENPDYQEIDEWQNKVFATAIKQEKLYEKLKEAYPNYYDIKFDSVTLSVNDIQKALHEKEKEIITFYCGKNNIYSLSISAETVQFERLEKSESLERAIVIYLEQMSYSPDITDPENYKLFCESAFQLYQSLMEPIIRDSNIRKNLVIIPHGELSILPFESLIKSRPAYTKVDYKNLDYLLNDYQFSYAYSANLLFKERIKRTKSDEPALLAFSYSNQINPQTKYNEIIGSSREINNISKLIDGTYYKGLEATESAFKSMAPQFDILHLAVHGKANDDSKSGNSLVFKNESDSANDGILYSYELLNLSLNAKLVVLSACETGLGKQFKGEGIFSMARSFAYAGSESIIMSYWKANDNATAEIMENFYKHLVEGATVDAALKNAKIVYMKNAEELTAHPSTWAAFVALGNMGSPVFQGKNNYAGMIWYFILGIIMLSVIFFSKKTRPGTAKPHPGGGND